MISRRGVFNKPRNVAIYLLRQIRGDDLNSIKKEFKINAYSTVSSIVQKISRFTKTDGKLGKEVRILKEEIIKGHIYTWHEEPPWYMNRMPGDVYNELVM